MSVTVQVGDFLSARIWTQLDEQAAVNTLNYEVISVTGGLVTDQDLADNIDTIVHTFYKNIMTTSTQYHGVQVYFAQRPAGTLPAAVKNTLNAGPGLQLPPTLPGNTAAVMKYSTNVRGPAGRGRIYLPFIGTGLVTADGVPATSLDVAINSLCSVLLNPLIISAGGSTATFIWTLFHRKKKPTPSTGTQITQAFSAQKFGQMHKRGSYGRANAAPI